MNVLLPVVNCRITKRFPDPVEGTVIVPGLPKANPVAVWTPAKVPPAAAVPGNTVVFGRIVVFGNTVTPCPRARTDDSSRRTNLFA